VLATDVSTSMLNLAADAARDAGLKNVETRQMDAENIDLDAASFDAVICRIGRMLFSDPVKALTGMHRVLKPRGKAVALVWFGSREEYGLAVMTGMGRMGKDAHWASDIF